MSKQTNKQANNMKKNKQTNITLWEEILQTIKSVEIIIYESETS